MNSTTYFFKDKPVFGLDVGHGSLKVMQINHGSKRPSIIGFGHTTFDASAIKDGVIVDPETVAKAAFDLFRRHLVGDITTKRVAMAIPVSRSFTRGISLPRLAKKELAQAVQLEAEEYIPVSIDELYLDYSIVRETADKTEMFAVAVPKKIVDSYMTLTRMLGLETVLIEPSIAAGGRLFGRDKQSDVPTVVIDFGSQTADISVIDGSVIVTGTVPGGGDIFSNLIAKKLGVTHQEAHIIKTKYGMAFSKKQKPIVEALTPTMSQIVKEIRRMIRYYEERYGNERKITQLVAMGGGANMPGLTEYFTNELRLASRACDPWAYIGANHLQPPNVVERSIYTTVAGLSLLEPRRIFA
ncbi:MAG TPA: type IV pilus assembly protein PilM [Candidatus Saccharimonadales bacterium]|jgi:type IV pilus assembly protein PilM|nr:type IV pilus assembly protein PilM [Candidatus Saccharimonadales bacterium]